MSKQSDAKSAQGYDPTPSARTCSKCAHYASDTVSMPGYMGGTYTKEMNIRCGIGGFAVKKMAVCAMFVSAGGAA